MIHGAQQAIDQIKILTARTELTVDGVGQLARGRSREFHVAISNLREVLENLNTLSSNLDEYPSLLLLGKPPKIQEKK